MTFQQAEQLRTILAETEVNLRPTPRGFNTARGVPDSVIWIEPANFRLHKMFPILVELEGRLFNVDDFRKFAQRNSAEEPYPHHITVGALNSAPSEIQLSLTYDIAAVGSHLLTDSHSEGFGEPEFHDALRDWAEDYESSFETEARTTVLYDTRIVWWKLKFPMYGHYFETEIPFIVDAGERLAKVLRLSRSRIVIPAVAVITGEDFLKSHTEHHETNCQFRRLHLDATHQS